MLAYAGTKLGYVDLMLSYVGHLRSLLEHLGAFGERFGLVLGRSWRHVWDMLAYVGLGWRVLKYFWLPNWPMLRQVGGMLGIC